jgi:hypothetical protein
MEHQKFCDHFQNGSAGRSKATRLKIGFNEKASALTRKIFEFVGLETEETYPTTLSKICPMFTCMDCDDGDEFGEKWRLNWKNLVCQSTFRGPVRPFIS